MISSQPRLSKEINTMESCTNLPGLITSSQILTSQCQGLDTPLHTGTQLTQISILKFLYKHVICER